ncbi:hypothetical protein P154DRAFT_430795 [Amniculicola lignicola CBS 123094]|uniref:FAD-binding FR-type domain-containing protein n=1 Tax=Amniculicola lignicola CBS 123094 TaxID=1392246 RepID=A0A6A5WXV5_9PLEO|nr:hypothetical protein P154DRAFT_430795 [Amniculicola lignicola CBS 123094]
MSWFNTILFRPRTGVLFAIGGGGALARYRFKSSSNSDAPLNPHSFTPYTLVDKQEVSSTSAIFTLRNLKIEKEAESLKEVWKRSVWSVQVKQPQLQIARAYTPLPNTSLPSDPGHHGGDKEQLGDIRLLIRQEEGGEVSTYLHGLPDKATIDLRGPNIELELPHDIKEVMFLAGGTGIAPAMQIAQAMSRRTGSRMHILWANRRREECIGGLDDTGDGTELVRSNGGRWRSLLGLGQPAAEQTLVETRSAKGKGVIVQELDLLKGQSRAQTRGLHVHYFVDEEKKLMKPGDVARRLGLEETETERGSRLILVSGPDGFIEHWAGKKLWIGGREVQGPLGGVLGQMDLKGWSVYKL